jgi:hypothetical protein
MDEHIWMKGVIYYKLLRHCRMNKKVLAKSTINKKSE